MTTGRRASIIINNYNYGHYLPVAIESALLQTYPDTEVIVVDDGSTDHSKEIIQSYGERIIPVYKSNGGQASCFNAGLLVSQGDVVFFLDADDFYKPELVSRVMAQWSDDVVKMHWPLIKTNPEGKPTRAVLPDGELVEGDLRAQLIAGGPSQCGGPPYAPPTSGNAWSRQFLDEIFPMPEADFRQGADNYLFVLAPLFGVIVKIDEPLAYYRVHGKNNTSKPGYILSYFNRFEACAVALSDCLAKQGIQKPHTDWPRDHWYHKVKAAMDQVLHIIPEGSAFILMDDNHWVTDSDFYGRKRIPFLSMNGEFAGAPVDDESAIAEIEKEKNKGAGFVVVPWSCFWYMDHYRKMKAYLETNATCLLANELVVIYDLHNQLIR